MPAAVKVSKLKPCDLPVHWFANQKAWMTSAIFNEWLAFVIKMKNKRHHILIVVHNVPSHVTARSLSNVEVNFLLPNLTIRVQTLDQAVIKLVKFNYRKMPLSSLVSNVYHSF